MLLVPLAYVEMSPEEEIWVNTFQQACTLGEAKVFK